MKIQNLFVFILLTFLPSYGQSYQLFYRVVKDQEIKVTSFEYPNILHIWASNPHAHFTVQASNNLIAWEDVPSVSKYTEAPPGNPGAVRLALSHGSFVLGEILVCFKDTVLFSEAEALVNERNLKWKGFRNVYRVTTNVTHGESESHIDLLMKSMLVSSAYYISHSSKLFISVFDSVDESDIQDLILSIDGLSYESTYHYSKLATIYVNPLDEQKRIAEFEELEPIKYAQLNFIYTTTSIP